MPVTQDAVFEKLKNVIDPELFVNIVDLGLIYEIKLSEATGDANAAAESSDATGATPDADSKDATAAPNATTEKSQPADGDVNVHIDMTMTSPACPAGPQLIGGAKQQVGSIEGVHEVAVKIVLDPPWTPDRMTEDAKDQLGIF